ncbi:MAG: hypothetical protein LLF86_01290 [Nitrospiraceae bacterium]|nr:hypothetical protein [Nitrospiraceae bacterium]
MEYQDCRKIINKLRADAGCKQDDQDSASFKRVFSRYRLDVNVASSHSCAAGIKPGDKYVFRPMHVQRINEDVVTKSFKKNLQPNILHKTLNEAERSLYSDYINDPLVPIVFVTEESTAVPCVRAIGRLAPVLSVIIHRIMGCSDLNYGIWLVSECSCSFSGNAGRVTFRFSVRQDKHYDNSPDCPE